MLRSDCPHRRGAVANHPIGYTLSQYIKIYKQTIGNI